MTTVPFSMSLTVSSSVSLTDSVRCGDSRTTDDGGSSELTIHLISEILHSHEVTLSETTNDFNRTAG
jgi:hypothetical protein